MIAERLSIKEDSWQHHFGRTMSKWNQVGGYLEKVAPLTPSPSGNFLAEKYKAGKKGLNHLVIHFLNHLLLKL